MNKSYYDTLGVPPSADSATIKKAFRRKAKETHPDKTNGGPDAFKELNRAYQTLKDPDSRVHYDQYGEAADKATTLREQAESQAATVLMAMVVGNAEAKTTDMIAKCRTAIKKQIGFFRDKMRQAKRDHEKAIDTRKRLKHKKQGASVLEAALDQFVDKADRNVKALEFEVAKGEEMLLVLDDYEWEYEMEQQVTAGGVRISDIEEVMKLFSS